MSSSYSELELAEIPAIETFQSLGYEYLNCYHEVFNEDPDLATLGRKTSMEVVLIPRLRSALISLNPETLPEIIDQAIEKITMDLSNLNPVMANKEIYNMLVKGINIVVRRDNGELEIENIKVIDFEQPENNDFLLASQFWITGQMYKRRADLIGFVNGLPLIFIELKTAHKKLENAFYQNLSDYKDTIPQLFWFNTFIILSNTSEAKVGTITSEWEHFTEWKKINSEGEQGIVSLDTLIKGVCEKRKFLDILENFILYQNMDGSMIKIMAKNHQFLGVNQAIEKFRELRSKSKENKKLGVFWHTQGSGKSFSMIFFSQKILRKFSGNYTFLIVTDRVALDDQIYKNFLSVGAVTEDEVHAKSCRHLRQLLKEDHRNIFTLIHKFSSDEDNIYPINERDDIIVITDEAHRTQYDTLALNMRKALPNASFIAFTATPLIVGEERTKETFGDYVSIYSYKQSTDDKATVPLYYENRIPEVELDVEKFSEGLEDLLDEAMLDARQEEKLSREFSKEYQIITREDRLEKIAEDIVLHFVSRGYQGKGMVVSIDKPTTVRMYDKVQKYWNRYIESLKKKLEHCEDDFEREMIEKKINYMKETDMAVVVSGEQNEIKKFNKMGLDIQKHRERMNKENLDDKFKDPKNPFRLVFVCAMWLTGFDVASLSTIYLDKPMKNHTLMQAIARANRVFKDKPNGLIVDYIGIFRNLKNALAIYTPGDEAIDYPVVPKEKLIKKLKDIIDQMLNFCHEQNINIQSILDSQGFERVKNLDEAVDKVLISDEVKNQYMSLANEIRKNYKAILPDIQADKFHIYHDLFRAIQEKIYSLNPEVDISEIKGKLENLLDESVGVVDINKEKEKYYKNKIDLSKIDFERIKKKFFEGNKHIEVERLKNAISRKINLLVMLNKSRKDLLEKFQKLIEEYNSGAINIEILFKELIDFAKQLDEEDKRHIREGFTEEELAIFDLLNKPDLSKKEEKQVKQASKELLSKLKQEKLVLEWRKKQQARASVKVTIEEILDKYLPISYSKDIFQEKCQQVYQHIYDSYFGAGKSIYEGTFA
ncbi:MAG TPA: DEAD/DEAH box helicase [Candidatus Atribacteria bacterium]|uniref:Type I restriction enzyme endonuclease subunit n=1 Tax=candidate division TA06 bacterium 34_109 TaxID=1635277 RepID=A0A117M642_UNCT6|nr:MAG: Type I site-specific deoxyribonuclease, HsdR family [candidate division TA06 bacterium 34_109]HBY57389.1 DEAD/DEAH box helicase [Candidatus Atribacteria bacterium]